MNRKYLIKTRAARLIDRLELEKADYKSKSLIQSIVLLQKVLGSLYAGCMVGFDIAEILHNLFTSVTKELVDPTVAKDFQNLYNLMAKN